MESGYLQDFLQLALWSQPQDLLRLLNAQHPAGSALRRFCNKIEIRLNLSKDDEKGRRLRTDARLPPRIDKGLTEDGAPRDKKIDD
jgi:hypothetical protein